MEHIVIWCLSLVELLSCIEGIRIGEDLVTCTWNIMLKIDFWSNIKIDSTKIIWSNIKTFEFDDHSTKKYYVKESTQ